VPIYHSLNLRFLRDCNKLSLPVFWLANKMSWVMQALFEDWFKSYYSPAVKNYCKQNNVTFKALVVLENASGRATVLNGPCEKCESHIFTSEHYIFATANGPGNNFNFQGLLSVKNYCASTASYSRGRCNFIG
jgi:hypothetical protein